MSENNAAKGTMTSMQYEVIRAVLVRGCPAIADDLISGINALIQENVELKKQLVDAKKQDSVKDDKKKETK